jgi:hypothetical protein
MEVKAVSAQPQFRFTCVNAFNDDFELKPKLFQATDDKWIAHLRWIFDCGNASMIAKFVEDHFLETILCGGVNKFDDFPFAYIPRLIDSLRRHVAKKMEARRRDYGAVSMVLDVSSRKMWDDYGGGGAGIALQFQLRNPADEISQNFAEPIGFSGEFGDSSIFAMRYEETHPVVEDLEVFQTIANDPNDGKIIANSILYACGALAGLSIFERQFCFKHTFYESECEWRLQRSIPPDSSGYYSSEALKLDRVILGPKMGRHCCEKIVELCRQYKMPVNQIKLRFDGSHDFVELPGS